MYKFSFRLLLTCLVLSFSMPHVMAKDIPISTGEEFFSKCSIPNSTFIIEGDVDLSGKTLNVLSNCSILVKNGSVYNGNIVGNNTYMVADGQAMIGVSLEGTWQTPLIDDRWFDSEKLSDNAIMENVNKLQSDEITNTILLHHDYLVDVNSASYNAFVLSSNTRLNIFSTIKINPNSFAKYAIIDISDKYDVEINCGSIIGDVGNHSYIPNSTSEWGMGINIVSSQNIAISNVTISYCTGDGIYIGGYKEADYNLFKHASQKISINHVTCDKNRRQGISLVHAKDVCISNSIFSNTGQIEFINPGHGIDIEPNISNERNMSVFDVFITNCKFLNNKGADLSTAHYVRKGSKSSIKNIIVENSEFTNEIAIRSGFFNIRNTIVPRLTINLSKADMGDIHVTESIIYGGVYLHSSTQTEDHPEYIGIIRKIQFDNCQFTNTKENKANSILALSGDMTKVKKLSFVGCTFNENENPINKKLMNKDKLNNVVFSRCKYSSKK